MGQSHTKSSEKQILDCINHPDNNEKITSLFTSFDVQKDGSLDKDEFRSFGKQLSHIMHHDHGLQDYVDSNIDLFILIYSIVHSLLFSFLFLIPSES